MQSVQRLWGEKFIKVWYNKSYAAGRFPYNDKNEEMHMVNGIIFLVGALIMFYMALRSVLREYNQPETVADQAWSYYQSAKSSMISSLGG